MYTLFWDWVKLSTGYRAQQYSAYTELSEFCTIVKGGRGKILFREVCNIFVRVLKISRDLTIFGRRIIDSSLFHHIVDLLP